jgi:hypothetical protein
MRAFQLETGSGMVKTDRLPGTRPMTSPTVLIRHEVFLYQSLVHILMAIHAALTHIAKMPFIRGLVTRIARRGHVCTIQWETSLVVPFDGEKGFGETPGGMAGCAIRRCTVPGKFLFMIIGVTIAALTVRQRCRVTGLVSGPAFQRRLRSLHSETGIVVVDGFPGF